MIATLIVLALGVVAFAYSGWYDVSASSPHSGLVSWLLSTTSHASVERRAGNVEVPDLTGAQMQLAGAGDYDAMCADCHGAPGRKPGALGQGLNPPPPDLAEHAAEMSPAELFWVTKHGIRMTGMPAWGESHDDAALWPVVAFLTRLPQLDAAAYQDLLARGKRLSHHSSSGRSGHGDGGAQQESHGQAAPGGEREQSQQHDHRSESPEETSAKAPPGHEGHDHDH